MLATNTIPASPSLRFRQRRRFKFKYGHFDMFPRFLRQISNNANATFAFLYCIQDTLVRFGRMKISTGALRLMTFCGGPALLLGLEVAALGIVEPMAGEARPVDLCGDGVFVAWGPSKWHR